MAYEPAFFEVFLGWTVVVAWSRWLLWRGAGAFFEWLPWIVGVVVLLGQVVATVSLLGGTSGMDTDSGLWLTVARWGPLSAVLAALALELAATLVGFSRRTA
jgi:hypothetical protein